MTTQRSGFMDQLDIWCDGMIGKFIQAYEDHLSTADHQKWSTAVQQIKKDLRQKVLESYRNGQKADRR